MEQTFMTIHNLSLDANILFASESIIDILGYHPHEVQGKSCFDYFHPEEVPFARSVHSRGVLLDKAAVLHYARILARDGQWISCECCFTVVHDVLVACTSIYRRGEKSERRAIEAPQIRRIFSCSPRDPRYHMLEHLSPKFKMTAMEREPRAALILNRFTRTLTVMFATNAVAHILGVRPDQIKDKSFYECIQENCLADAIKCLESAKANDSIAYLRFWYRDPRRPEDFEGDDDQSSEQPGENSSDSDGGGVHLDSRMDVDAEQLALPQVKSENMARQGMSSSSSSSNSTSNSASNAGFVSGRNSRAYETLAGEPSMGGHGRVSPAGPPRLSTRQHANVSFELEAVVSCTSDGLVVVLRKARPPIPAPHPPLLPFDFENGLFAAPWGQQPIRPQYPPDMLYTFRPPLMPQYMPLRENVKAAGGPPLDQLMRSIRDVAVFAWALVGINGNLVTYGHGHPRGEAQPPDGLPVWDPNAGTASYLGPENQAARRWANLGEGKASLNATAQFAVPVPYELPRDFHHLCQRDSENYTYGGSAWRPLRLPGHTYEEGQHSLHQGVPQPQQQHHQQRQPEDGFQGSLHDRAWGESPPPHIQGGFGVPTTQADSEEPTQGFRYPWP